MEIVPLSAFRDNYIWTIIQGDCCVVVDPGDAAPVLRFLAERKLRLTGILVTHHHNDHVGGIHALIEQAAVPVFGPRNESIPHCTHALGEGDQIRLPGISLQLSVLDVPGHTAGHIAYLGQEVLFCGDTLFGAGCGRLLGGTAEQLFASLQRLATLPPNTRVYCTHEYTLSNLRFARVVDSENMPVIARQRRCEGLRTENLPTVPSEIGEELLSNPFLRCTEAAVKASAESFAGRKLGDALAVFTALRKWKDEF